MRTTLVAIAGAALLAAATVPRLVGEAPRPRAAVAEESGTHTLFADRGGHFWADAMVDGTHVSFLVDTGATMIVLTGEDARRIGIDVDALAYRRKVATANGVIPVAEVRIPEVEVGGIGIRNVDALVPQLDGLETSLLGMNFLKRLSRFEIDGNRMVLVE